jgi:hypothetical protein
VLSVVVLGLWFICGLCVCSFLLLVVFFLAFVVAGFVVKGGVAAVFCDYYLLFPLCL